MGSFNETCALSRFNIAPGDKVRMLFLTQNPYVSSDQRFAQRGCYINDQWFVRTPAIKGKYADYGDCDFEENEITALIAEMFDKDVVELPYGFNRYHAQDVTKGKGIHNYVAAAWQGRLAIRADLRYDKKGDRPIPFWKEIQNVIEEAKLPIQSKMESEKGGYNAQSVRHNVVCVTFSSYGETLPQLKKVQRLLKKFYDVRIVYKEFKQGKNTIKSGPCLIVVPVGAFENYNLLIDSEKIAETLTKHPEYNRYADEDSRQQPVLSVMIREDVWQTYMNCEVKSKYAWDKVQPVSHYYEEMKVYLQKLEKRKEENQRMKKLLLQNGNVDEEHLKYYDSIEDVSIKQLDLDIPFQTTPGTHLNQAANKDKFEQMGDLLQGNAELFKIQLVMSRLHHSWHIPCLGGQDGSWKMQVKLQGDLAAIAAKCARKRS